MLRSTSAYDNNCCLMSCDEREVGRQNGTIATSTSFCEQLIVFEDDEIVEKEEEVEVEEKKKKESVILLEISVERDPDQLNGIGFRLVGSKSRGIFVSYIHPNSSPSSILREGDRIVRCNSICLRAVSADQAASILKYWMNRINKLELQIERRQNGEKEMSRRRRQARLSMCLDKKEKIENQMNIERRESSYPATIRLTTSHSAEIFPNTNSHSTTKSFNRYKSPRYVSFDTSTQPKTIHICPTCNNQIKLPYLHQFSHGFRFLTFSRSSYSLL